METRHAFTLALVVALSACAANPGPSSSAYKQGTLGNGGFLFKCDDSVACDRWSTNDAKDFPSQIATGAVFDVRFVASGDQGTPLTNGDKYPGLTTEAVAPYVGTGPNGLVTLKPGYGTLIARDNAGTIIDYVTVNIVKPDGLVVYDAAYKGSDPPSVQTLTMRLSDARRSFRTVSVANQQPIAGSIMVEWTSTDANVVQIESYTRGVVNVVAKGAGKATLHAAGAAQTKDVPVEVTP